MQTIRTTINLPEDMHHKLRSKAFRYHKSLNKVIIEQLSEKPEREYTTDSLDKKIQDNLAFFKRVGKMGKKIDWQKVIREERDRDG